MLKKLDLTLYYGLFVLAFVMPISIAAVNIVWILLFLVWIIKIILKKSEDISTPVTVPILIFFFSTVISSIFGLNFTKSLTGLNSEMLFFIFFLVSSNIKNYEHAKKIVFVFIISSSIMGLLGVIQYVTGKSFSGAYIFGMIDGRVHGTRSWPLTYAEGLLMALPISIYTLLHGKRKYISYLLIIFIFLGIIFSFARMVWISSVIILAILLYIRKKQLKNLVYIFVIGLIISIFSGIYLTGRRNIISRATYLNDPVRTNMWKTSFEIFKDYPLLGVGLKNIKRIYPQYYEKLGLSKDYYLLSHLHSNFVHILVERGIIGLIAFLYIFGVYFYYGIKKAIYTNDDEKSFLIVCLFGIIGFLLSGITEYSYGDSEIQMMMWFLMALTFYKSRAVFLDRDGTIIEDTHYSADIKKLKVFEKSFPAIKLLNDAGFKNFVVTNQSGIARGYSKRSDVCKMNKTIVETLKEKGALVNYIYFCPHKPDDKCACRKPEKGMIIQAKKDFNIDLKYSYVVGDAQSDINLAKNIGAKSIFVLTGDCKKVEGADYIAKDVSDAAEWIIKQS
ncbi:MAG: HAD-IIIA family hydrolase [Elusimicrobia bacterium]|nr:HAD-IIIA family hydrolase [Elusimicrobiota bacterium]